MKPAPFCKLFTGVDSTNKSVVPLLFSCSQTLVVSLPLCSLLHLSFYLKLIGSSGKNCLLFPPLLLGYNGSLNTHFFWEMQLMGWPVGVRYSNLLQSFVVSLFLSLISTLLFSWTGCVRYHLNSLTHRSPRYPLKNLSLLIMLTMSFFVYAAADTVFC